VKPLNTLRKYIILSKPRLVYLLFFTGFVAMVIAGSLYGYDWWKIIILSLAIIFGVMGSNAMTNFVDRKIDGIMERTKKRPIPSGTIKSRDALIYAIVMVSIGTIMACIINIWSGVFILLGFLDSAIIYNALTKRRTPLNIILGAPAGGMPVIAGWMGIAGRLELLPVMLFILILIWTPIHIWSLAYFYREDYRKAGIPMLPVIIEDKKVYILLAVLNFIMIGFSVYIGYLYSLSLVYLISSAVLGIIIIFFSLRLIVREEKKIAWVLFKLTSPYLAIIFIILVIEFTAIK
jgi:heme o synthase